MHKLYLQGPCQQSLQQSELEFCERMWRNMSPVVKFNWRGSVVPVMQHINYTDHLFVVISFRLFRRFVWKRDHSVLYELSRVRVGADWLYTLLQRVLEDILKKVQFIRTRYYEVYVVNKTDYVNIIPQAQFSNVSKFPIKLVITTTPNSTFTTTTASTSSSTYNTTSLYPCLYLYL